METSRRDLIKKGAAAGAAAWVAPAVAIGAPAPAMAATPIDPCGVNETRFAVALWSPQPGTLVDRPNPLGAVDQGGCTSQAPFRPGDGPNTSGLLFTTRDSIGLTNSPTDMRHVITSLTQAPVTLNLVDTCCVFTRIWAHVHRFGSPTSPTDCPNPYYRVAGASDRHLLITAGGYGQQSITVQPNPRTDYTPVCRQGRQDQSLHWGSPNRDRDCQERNRFGESYGQPFGYMLIELTCEQ